MTAAMTPTETGTLFGYGFMAILLILVAIYILGNVFELFEFGKFWKSGSYAADRKPATLDHFDEKVNHDGGSNE